MNKVVPLKNVSKIIVTENCGNAIIVSMVDTNVIVTKPNNIVNITNCGS